MTEEHVPKFEHLDIGLIDFDPNNPRLPTDIDGNELSEVMKFMITSENLEDLVKSIGLQGYFSGEPLLIVPNENVVGRYIAVEGNRRLAALKILTGAKPPRKASTFAAILEEVTRVFETVPCMIYERREDVLGYLGYRHITGIQEWDHLAKARYLKQLYQEVISEPPANVNPNDKRDVYRYLAKKIGSKAHVVANLMNGIDVIDFADNNNILTKLDKDPAKIGFSLLTTALSYEPIRNYVFNLEEGTDRYDDIVSIERLDQNRIENILYWLYGDADNTAVIADSREIATLNKVLQNENATEYLISHRGDKTNLLQSAFTLSGGMMEGFDSYLQAVTENLELMHDLAISYSLNFESHHLSSTKKAGKMLDSLQGIITKALERD